MDFDLAIEKLRYEEGYRRHPYRDTKDILTVGYGRNLQDNGISEKEAEYLLKNDINRAYEILNHAFGFFAHLTNDRQICLVDMCVNMGFARLATFKKMIAALYDNDYKTARKELLDSKYARDLQQRAERNAFLMYS